MRRSVVATVVFVLAFVPGAAFAAEQVEPATGDFTPSGALAEPRVDHTATLLPDGRVLVTGGAVFDRPASLTTAEVWDPQTASFRSTNALAEGREGHTATLLPDGRVLVIGGTCCGRNADITEMWDPVTEALREATPLVKGRIQGGHTATLLADGRVLVIGGDDHRSRNLKLAEVWDPVTETFGEAGRMAKVRSGHTATLLSDGRVLVIGGSPGTDNRKLARAEAWDPASESFSPAGALVAPRGGHTATALPDGRVLVVGGIDAMNDVLASAEVWNPATETFREAGDLAEARLGHTATLLPDGRVLVIAGNSGVLGISALRSAEVWDPATESFSPASSLAEGRRSHTATLLPDGRVLIVAGNRDGDQLGSSQVWDPTAEAPTPWPSTRLKGAEAITAGHDRFVVVGEGGKRKPFAKAWASTDGLSWTRAPAAPALEGAGMSVVSSTDHGFVALGADADGRVAAWHSPDGLAWERAKVKRPGSRPYEAAVRSVVAGPSGLLAYADFLGQDFAGNRMWRSSDGRTWRPVQLPRSDSGPFGSLVAIPDGYLLINDDTTALWRSEDGLGWTTVVVETIDGWLARAASSDDGTVVAIGVRHVEPYPLAAWATRDLESWELTWQSLDPESAAACEGEAALTVEAIWVIWDGSQFAAHAFANRDWCDETTAREGLPLLLSSDGYTWVESFGPDGAPGYDEGLWVNDVASLGRATVVLGGIDGGPATAWLLEPAAPAVSVPY